MTPRALLVLGALAALLAGCGPAAAAPVAAGPAAATAARVLPVTISIPRIGVTSSLIQTGLNPDHTIEVPPLNSPGQASWYRGSPAPGQVGPAVLLGHVNAYGTAGVFARLHELVTGDRIEIAREDGSTLAFVVTSVTLMRKDQFDTAAVYGNVPTPQLRVITCGGELDTTHHSYLSNVIVNAEEVS